MKRTRAARDGIFQYGDRWGVDYVDPGTGRRRRRRGFSTRTLALTFRRTIDRQHAGLEPLHTERLSFDALVKQFLENYRTRSGRMDYYEERFRIILPYFSGMRADYVHTVDVDRFRKAREAQVSSETVRKDLVTLSTLFRWGKARGIVARNPADPDLVKRPAKAKPNPQPLSAAQVVDLLDASPAWLQPIIELGIEIGADRSELLRLNWHRHIDRDRLLIRLARGKTGVGRTLPYRRNATIKRILGAAGKVRHPSGVVFLRKGEPVGLEAAKSAMRRAWTSIGGKTRPWKSLRATFATRALERGIHAPVIGQLMGLTTAHVLDHYVKPSGLMLEDAMADACSAAEKDLSANGTRSAPKR